MQRFIYNMYEPSDETNNLLLELQVILHLHCPHQILQQSFSVGPKYQIWSWPPECFRRTRPPHNGFNYDIHAKKRKKLSIKCIHVPKHEAINVTHC